MERIWNVQQELEPASKDAKERVWLKLNQQIKSEPSIKKPKQRILLLRIAAAVVVMLIAGFALFQHDAPEDVVRSGSEQRAIELSDGSSMLLNANSLATYVNPRKVSLDGEAYFDVQKKLSAQTFEVHTKHAMVEVLGTRFNVKSTDEYTSVYLEEGSVRLYCHEIDSVILMEPGDLVTYDKNTQVLTQLKDETAQTHIGWREGVTLLEDMKLRLVLEKIEEVYDIEFEVSESSNIQRIVTFPLPTSSLDTTISLLENTLIDLEISKDGNKYIVRPK